MRKLIVMIIPLLVFLSCTDLEDRLYDRIPEDRFPENDQQISGLAIPVYTPLNNLLDWGGWWFCQELTTDAVVCPTRDTDWDDGGKWRVLHQHTWLPTTEAVEGMWGTFYAGIVEANKLIERMEVDEGNPAVDKALAKVRAMRGLYYYYLIDNYGNVPYLTSYSNAPQFPRKSPRDSVWQAIINDVAPYIRFLENKPSSKYVATKGMAYMLMAKLYLNAEVYTGTSQWEKAAQYCDSVLELGYALESNPLAPFVTSNENSPEIIFSIPFDEDANKGFNLHMRTLHYNSNLTFNMQVGPWNGFAVTEQHFNTYSDNDKRKAGFLVGLQRTHTGEIIRDQGAGNAQLSFNPVIPALLMDATYTKVQIRMSGARVAKFEIKLGAKDNLSNDFPIFRQADAMLMKAEVALRLGDEGEAVQLVNDVRRRCFDSYVPLTSVSLDDILEERGREFFWEAHRRQDLIRFGKFNDPWWEKPASSSQRNIFPIPQWAIDSNPNLGL